MHVVDLRRCSNSSDREDDSDEGRIIAKEATATGNFLLIGSALRPSEPQMTYATLITHFPFFRFTIVRVSVTHFSVT
jgi:hypothetical protein